MVEAIWGVVAAIAIIILAQVLSRFFSIKLFATACLVAIAFIYVGFSLKDNPASSIILESGVAILLYFVALFGYTRNSSLIAYGIIFHGIWDILHHDQVLITTDVPVYWPTFCFTIDIIDGLYFLIIFKRKAKTP
jgi:hypothetical protein